ncbi:ATP synthase subunit delta [Flexivirga endophytica]|uniref:ATP synthase subunit delta n=1 Tax=Flexivirga endophytica TaxID=1849103 RepID=A0A916SV42_9MICO|nr:F0F1 ATP synthase subunit delta [Flexivirga endophytica]GGB15419.1 ATP synthase subunit delta [Flexivirga endophytica]GHB40152.1 ATP synthase subunit delta [Flexivirga endophytica]
MQGASRGSLLAVRQELSSLLGSGSDANSIGDELFAIAEVLGSSAGLRRALTDPTAEASAKETLADRLFGGKVGDAAQQVLRKAVGQRWAGERDLGDALEQLGVEATLTSAERAGRLDNVEDELFRFERTIAGDAGLRDAFGDRRRSGKDKADLVGTLLDGKAAAETTRLARQAAANPGGRRVERVLESYVAVAAQLRDRLAATVTSAVELGEADRSRLGQSLARVYGRPVQLNVIVDPNIVGGLRVQVGDEVIDGTIATRLEDARRTMAG